jgi:hypothetical protein
MLLARSPKLETKPKNVLPNPSKSNLLVFPVYVADSLDSTAHLHPPKTPKFEDMTRVVRGSCMFVLGHVPVELKILALIFNLNSKSPRILAACG